jgi:hypothetical protein
MTWFPVGLLAAVPLSAACTIALSPADVVGDGRVAGAVTLAAPAPAAGLIITLTSSTPSAQVSSQVLVQSGQSTAAFTVSTSPVIDPTQATITAAAGVCAASAAVTVHPAVLAGLSLSDTTSRGNTGLRGDVTLTGPAPSTGAIVKLWTSDLLVTVPAFVSIPAGETSASFTLAPGKSLSRNSVAVSAIYGASVQTALLNVLPGI